ncbi:MAG: SRPBCC family protein [Candidatus Sulfobium sp.]
MIEVTVTINAGISKVWEMFVDLSRWREWNTVLTIVSPGEEGKIAEGKSFAFLMRPLAFVGHLEPMAEEVLPFKRIVLTGHRFGIRARHEFFFEGNEAGTTVRSRETFTGITPALPGWSFLQWRLKKLTGYMLRDLKIAAESSP